MSGTIMHPQPPLSDAAIAKLCEIVGMVAQEALRTPPENREERRASWAAHLRDAANVFNQQREQIHNDSGGALNIEKRADGYHISVGINEAKAMALINSMRDPRQPHMVVREDGSLLHAHPPQVCWVPTEGTRMALNGEFNDIQLRALAWWVGERKR